MGDELGWNDPLILTFDPNFQRDIQALKYIGYHRLLSVGLDAENPWVFLPWFW